MDLNLILELVFFVVLIVLSAFFSGSETAMTSIGKMKAKRIIEKDRSAMEMDDWLRDPNRILTTILVGNNFVNIAASILGHIIVEEILIDLGMSHSAAMVGGVTVAIVTFILLVFGEVTPKIYCRQNAEQIGPKVIRILNLLYFPFYPIIKLMQFIAGIVVRVLGSDLTMESPFMTEEDLKLLLDVSETEGVIEETEREMIHSIVDFGDTVTKEIMTPRVDMATLPGSTSIEEAAQFCSEVGHSRVPVYEGSNDNITGILYVKDLLKLLTSDEYKNGNGPPKINKIMRRVHYIPDNKKVAELLRDFQSEKTHIAIVVDEYGGTAGLITIEDVLEEIVGEIQDEYDVEPDMVRPLSASLYEVDAKIDVEDLHERLGIELEGEDFETLGGFIASQTGKIPQVGETIAYKNFTFTITSADSRHVDTLQVEIKEPLPEEEE